MKIEKIQNASLKNFCTMKVGGKCENLFMPSCIKQLIFCLKKSKKYFLLGCGSNVLFKDEGLCCDVICTKKMTRFKIKKNVAICECGVNLFVLNKALSKNNLSGLEWSYGIPATIGGAAVMNAGAYGGEMKDVITKVLVFDGKKKFVLKNKQLCFEYRNSIIKKQKLVVLKVWLKLKKVQAGLVSKSCDSFLNLRKQSQPLEKYNSGSIFKKSYVSAGKLIDKTGLKGCIINNAEVSKKHANFIVNNGNAKCEDVLKLIAVCKQKVKEKFNVDLQEEVIVACDENESY